MPILVMVDDYKRSSDALKKTSRQAVRGLQKMGLEVVMLTGDNQQTAEATRKLPVFSIPLLAGC